MDTIKIPTTLNIELEFEAPEFHKRMFAWLIDFFFLAAYSFIISKLLELFLVSSILHMEDATAQYNSAFLWLICYSPVLVYHLVCELLMNGQSIGKKLLGIRVISETGSRPALYQYLLRWLLRLVDFGFSLGAAALISSLASRKGQRLGDLAAGTLVIKTNQKNNLDETVFFELDENYQVRYPQVMQLSDRDMNVVKGIIDYCNKHNNYSYADRTVNKIRTVLQVKEYEDNRVFLETLLKDYNHLSNQ